MTPEARKDFLAERKGGIGGSDVAALFNVGYGCKLQLWREKRDEAPDFPDEQTGPMSLGILLEDYFADHYAQITGRSVHKRGQAVHPVHPELRVHVDRMIQDSSKPEVGVLEIKAQGRGAWFNTKRSGTLPEDYLLQLQHGMLVTGASWGSFAVGCRDFGVSKPSDLLWWDVQRSDRICDEILDVGPAFWATVENGPMPEALAPDDDRCQECCYRTSCQGGALIHLEKPGEYVQDESLRPLALEYIERSALKKEAEALLDETKAEIKARLAGRPKVAAAGAKLQYWRYEYDAYTVKAGTKDHFRVYPGKEGR